MTMSFTTLHLRKIAANHSPDPGNLLGTISYGAQHHAPHPTALGSVPMAVMPDDDMVHTAWFGDGPFNAGQHDALHYRHDRHLLFGHIALDETGFAANEEAGTLQQASRAAYAAIFDTMQQMEFAYLVRCWNYLPAINSDENGLERYRQFNIGRQQAFIAARHSHLDDSPASSALGTASGKITVYFIASRRPAQAIENPRQISAYHYPVQYGPRSPTFSRATLLPMTHMDALFISGTASIVGHQTLHHDDVRAQTLETLRNIDTIIEQANLISRADPFSTRELSLKVFIRHAHDLVPVTEVLHAHLGDAVDTLCLHADICRADLLLEIEAFGCRSKAQP